MICRSSIYLFYALHIQEGQVGGASSPLILLQGAYPTPPPPNPLTPRPQRLGLQKAAYIYQPRNQAVCPCTKPSLPAWLSFCYATLLVLLLDMVIYIL
jgi:hypothetical protein